MSFELWGAIEALRLLEESGSPRDQAELVAETINRHQDLGETGMVPVVLAFIYFGTLLGMFRLLILALNLTGLQTTLVRITVWFMRTPSKLLLGGTHD